MKKYIKPQAQIMFIALENIITSSIDLVDDTGEIGYSFDNLTIK